MKATKKAAAIIITAAAIVLTSAIPAFAATRTSGNAVEAIKLSKTVETINVGKKDSLTVSDKATNKVVDAEDIYWTSSNTSIVTVNEDGDITAKKPGTATVKAIVDDAEAICKVTVKAPLQSIAMSKTSASINVGASVALSVSYAPSNTTDSKNVTWTTSNSSVATVSGGKVTGKKAGTAKITAKVGSFTKVCTVTVKAVKGSFVNTNACYSTLNTYRTKAKVAKLTKNTTLENAAKTRAKELVTKFSHTRPNGKSGLTVISGNKYKGENIAKGQKSCADVMKAWYNSKGHKANMLNKNYKKVGIAGWSINGTIYWVQLFSS